MKWTDEELLAAFTKLVEHMEELDKVVPFPSLGSCQLSSLEAYDYPPRNDYERALYKSHPENMSPDHVPAQNAYPNRLKADPDQMVASEKEVREQSTADESKDIPT